DASDGTTDNVFNVSGDLLITSTGSITCNDPASPSGADACPITIHLTGNLVMQAGSKIQAEDQVDGGSGGNISITVDGNMTMCGPAGAKADCGGAGLASTGALISSQKITGAGDTGDGGDITITVGNLNTVTGDF